MAGIVSNPDPRLALPGLAASDAPAITGDKGMLSLFETTLSGLMPAPDSPQAGVALALAPATPPTPGSSPMAPAREGSLLSLPVPETPPVIPGAAQEALPVVPSDTTGHIVRPYHPDEPAPQSVRAPERVDAREQPTPAMTMHGTLLASRLVTTLPAARQEVTAADTDADTDTDADADQPVVTPTEVVSVAAPSPQTILLPVQPVIIPVPMSRQPVSATSGSEPGRLTVAAAGLPVPEASAQPLPARPTSEPAASRPDIMPLTHAVSSARQSDAARVRADGGSAIETVGMPRDAAPAATATTASAVPVMASPAEATRPAAVSQPPATLTQTPLQSPAWAHVASQRLAWMVQGGESTAVLAIHPESLGPIHVRIHMDGQNARIDLAAQQPVTVTLLESHLPRLTAALESQGVRVDELKVGNQALAGDFSSAQNPFSGQQAEAGGQGARQPRWMATAGSVGDSRQSAAEAVPTAAPRRATSRAGQVDDFA